MSEKKFTLVELHLDGETQFGPRSLPGPGILTGDDDGDVETEGVGTSPQSESPEADDSRGLFPVIAGLIAMAAVAVAVRRYRRDEGAETEQFEERDVVVD